MQQETINRASNGINVSFQQKSTGLSLVITSSATLYYVVHMWPVAMRAGPYLSSMTEPAGIGTNQIADLWIELCRCTSNGDNCSELYTDPF